jgi:hypothetical protein
MKKIALFSFMVVAVLGMMTSRAQGDEYDWSVSITIANSAETPVMLSLESNDKARARFPNNSTSWTLQPGQSTVVSAERSQSPPGSLEWNIIYNFYDGTNIIQSVSSKFGAHAEVASFCQFGLYSVSVASYVDATWTNGNAGQQLASGMGLHGISAKIVSILIDLGDYLAGDPFISHDAVMNYSVTIGQNDYNIDKLAGVNWAGWTYYLGAPPPPVTFVQGQQIYGYNYDKPWLSSQSLNNNSTIAAFTGANASIGTTAGQIASFDMSSAAPQSPGYTTFRSNGSVVQMSRNPKGSLLQYVAAFDDSSVWYYDGANVTHLAGIGTGSSAILQMSVNWGESAGAGAPQIVVGCADGQVEYFNGSSWTELHDIGWATSIMQLSAYWDSNNKLQAVVGLGDGAVEYWNGSGWTELHNTGWSNPVYQLKAQFWNNQQPNVLVALMDGAILSYTPASGWTQIHNNDYNYSIIDMAPQGDIPFPTFVAGFNDGSVSCFIGGKEYSMVFPTGNRVQFISAGYWDYSSTAGVAVAFVYSHNYQFTCVIGKPSLGTYSEFSYPAIPSVSSACGDIDGDGKGDLISVEGSDWYVWYSSKQYSKRYGPYDRGVFGTPVIGDVDGDGQGDLIMVDGSRWYVWTSSSGYTNRIDWDLGIYGHPMTGDIDGDGKDDAIVVRGSQWYVWTSSSGYTKRLGPYDLGIHGLPAAGDIDGDGKADLVIAVGSNWYTWSAASKHQVRSGPYNMGISGTPKIADIDGDGLADLIVIVGSDWYVWFSSAGYQRFGPYTMNLP